MKTLENKLFSSHTAIMQHHLYKECVGLCLATKIHLILSKTNQAVTRQKLAKNHVSSQSFWTGALRICAAMYLGICVP